MPDRDDTWGVGIHGWAKGECTQGRGDLPPGAEPIAFGWDSSSRRSYTRDEIDAALADPRTTPERRAELERWITSPTHWHYAPEVIAQSQPPHVHYVVGAEWISDDEAHARLADAGRPALERIAVAEAMIDHRSWRYVEITHVARCVLPQRRSLLEAAADAGLEAGWDIVKRLGDLLEAAAACTAVVRGSGHAGQMLTGGSWCQEAAALSRLARKVLPEPLHDLADAQAARMRNVVSF